MTTTYQYDNINRVKQTNYSDGTPFTLNTWDFATDGRGRFYANYESSTSGTLNFVSAYDAMGRPTEGRTDFYLLGTGWMPSYTTSREYDLMGHVTKQTYPTGRVVNYDQFHADGRVKFASDFYSRQGTGAGVLDRAYDYDGVGRLKEAYAGAEARDFLTLTNSGVADGAYRQSYTHDAWGNQTSRTGRMWSQPESVTASYDARQRNPEWTYDASGHLISRNEPMAYSVQPYQAAQHTYDAAGRHAALTQTLTRYEGTSAVTTVTTTTQTYDGDGRQVGSTEAVTRNGAQAPNSPQTTYSLRSSVLGGRTITEYDASGTRQTSYSYLGGAVLSETVKDSQGTTYRQQWRHTNPVTGDAVNTDSGAYETGATRLDPAGVNLGETDPWANLGGGGGTDVGPVELNGLNMLPVDAGWAGGGSGPRGMQCFVDGVRTECAYAFMLLETESVRIDSIHGATGGIGVPGVVWRDAWEPCTAPGADICSRNAGYFQVIPGAGGMLASHIVNKRLELKLHHIW